MLPIRPKSRKVDTARAIELYTIQHLTMAEIGKIFGVTRSAISRTLERAGINTTLGERVNVRCDFCGRNYSLTRKKWKTWKHHFCREKCYFNMLARHDSKLNWRGTGLARQLVARYFLLMPEHIVHHVDGDDLNNTLSNLWVFRNQRDHLRFHGGFKVKPLWRGEHESKELPWISSIARNGK